MRLTDTKIRSLRGCHPRREIRDSQCPNLYLHIYPSGSKTFFYRYRRPDGRLHKVKLGRFPALSLAKARSEASGLTVQRDSGEPLPAIDRGGLTIESLVAMYVQHLETLGRKYSAEVNRALKNELISRYGDRHPTDVAKHELIDILNSIATGRGAVVMANRTRQFITGMYRWASAEDLIESDPSAGIRPRGPEKSRDRTLNRDEIRLLWNGLERCPISESTLLLLRLKLLTAKRSEELVSARWEDLGADWWIAPPSTTKSGKAHRFPITPFVQNQLDQLKSHSNGSKYLFPSRVRDKCIRADSVSRAVTRIRPMIGISHWTAHDLRRTVATQLAELGVLPHVIRRVLNHSDASVTAIYNRYDYGREVQTAVHGWHKYLSRVIAT